MFEWRQEPSLSFATYPTRFHWSKVTRNQTKLLSLKSKHKQKNRNASGLNENGSNSYRMQRNGMSWKSKTVIDSTQRFPFKADDCRFILILFFIF